MQSVRTTIGGLGNLMFKQAYLWSQMRKGEIPDVYVQGIKYWRDYADEVKQLFGVGQERMAGVVSLHIRRGDYLEKNGFYVDLTQTDYYQKAIQHFPADSVYLVFYKDRQGQDERDKEYADKFMKSLGVEYELWKAEVEETEDLNAMARCEGHIMANSSFSWWAAFLGGGKTVCPRLWFTDGQQRCELLEEWIKI